jgi:hypothetical protein
MGQLYPRSRTSMQDKTLVLIKIRDNGIRNLFLLEEDLLNETAFLGLEKCYQHYYGILKFHDHVLLLSLVPLFNDSV